MSSADFLPRQVLSINNASETVSEHHLQSYKFNLFREHALFSTLFNVVIFFFFSFFFFWRGGWGCALETLVTVKHQPHPSNIVNGI